MTVRIDVEAFRDSIPTAVSEAATPLLTNYASSTPEISSNSDQPAVPR